MPYLPPSPQSPSHSSLIKSDQRITAPQQLDFKVICWCRQNLLNWLTSALLGSSYKLAHLFNLVTVERHFEAGGDPSLTFALTLFPPQSSKLTSPLHFHTFMVTVALLLACLHPPTPSPADRYCHPCLQAVQCFRTTFTTATCCPWDF